MRFRGFDGLAYLASIKLFMTSLERYRIQYDLTHAQNYQFLKIYFKSCGFDDIDMQDIFTDQMQICMNANMKYFEFPGYDYEMEAKYHFKFIKLEK
jgi:hypothetical protein